MAATVTRIRPTLAHVLLDIASAEARLNAHWGDYCESDLADILEALREEARSMIEEANGVAWDQIAARNL